MRCWGGNDQGQLGDGSTTPRSGPVTVSNDAGTGPLTGITASSPARSTPAPSRATGQVRCRGDNAFGALGDGTTTSRTRPVPVLAG